MDQGTVREFVRATGDDPTAQWQPGDAWLAGGTFLFSTPLPELRRLIDLTSLGWPSLEVSENGLRIAATCRVVELYEFKPPADWAAGPFLREAVDSFLAGFKIWNTATVGGNVCTSLPASPMTTMGAALDATLEIWGPGGARRTSSVPDFILSNHVNSLQPGELLRAIDIPLASLKRRYSYQRFTLTKHGRSSEFLVGTSDPAQGDLILTITAATSRPFVLRFAAMPSAAELRDAITAAVSDPDYFDDPNGSPAHRKHMTYYLAELIRADLAGEAS
ncbi:MAG: FAD-binding molybdopterin dehydrogenase [Actinomycetales bacterium mxb001]|nr:MAG: FAD-binding molybdopterin dehydrogenase [Actinomycetales bacterium mxb001]